MYKFIHIITYNLGNARKICMNVIAEQNIFAHKKTIPLRIAFDRMLLCTF